MTPLSAHFNLEDFEQDSKMPMDCIEPYKFLCENILEPLRAQAGKPLIITSGYRSPEANTEAHGQPNSEHVATADYCAADFYVGGMATIRPLFDWARENPSLPYHQLILESGITGTSILHVSYNRLKPGVRSVLIGATHNSQPLRCGGLCAVRSYSGIISITV